MIYDLRYHGTPKLTMFSKNHFCHFQIDIIQTSLLQKASEKKIVSPQSLDEKRFVALIFSNHVLTVICQQR